MQCSANEVRQSAHVGILKKTDTRTRTDGQFFADSFLRTVFCGQFFADSFLRTVFCGQFLRTVFCGQLFADSFLNTFFFLYSYIFSQF